MLPHHEHESLFSHHKIGRRNIKTAVAVFLALLVKVLLMLCIDLPTGTTWSKIIYTPFFGGIAAAYSMHMDKHASMQQAKIRTMGSIFGGLYGMVVLILSEVLLEQLVGLSNTSVVYYLLDYTFVAAAIILLIHITVITRKTYATWIACLTYLSVTVSIRNDFDAQLVGFFTDIEVLNTYLIAMVFAFNRILSTVIGVGISLFVNLFTLPRHNNQDILFVSSLDKAILNKQDQITGFTKYKINQLSNGGCHITFATTRTQASLNRIFSGIDLKMPLITMNGSAIYHPKEQRYLSIDHINQEARRQLDALFLQKHVSYFCCTVDDNILQIYHGKLENEGEILYYRERRDTFFDNFVRGTVPDELEVCFYELVAKQEVILDIVHEIEQSDYAQKLDVLHAPYKLQGYELLKINSKNSNKGTRLQELKEQTHSAKLVVFGSGESDIDMMRLADISLCLKSAPDHVKAEATFVLDTEDPDAILKTIEKIYHIKNFSAYRPKSLAPTK
jgi:hypothetical protein